ncbi:MAG: T9SS type A sorting domain-containing protein [Candidatus Kapaibacterium sp.]
MNELRNCVGFKRCIGFFSLCMWGILSAVAGLQAQQWEYVYGGASCVDGGEAVTTAAASGNSCAPLAGYISVGWTYSTTTSSCNATKDIFIVRANQNGALAWEKSYDIGGNDHAYDVKECANGDFIIVGTTDNTPPPDESNCFGSTTSTYDIFLMRIDPCGTVLWLETYGTDTTTEVGYEVIEAANGNGTTTNTGDFVVAGYYQSSTTLDALLFRTTANGVLIWDQTYGTLQYGDEFHALTETSVQFTPLNPSIGDIVAVGRSAGQNGGTWDIYVVRVNGNTGAIGGAPQGAIVYGGTRPEVALSVAELVVAPNAGQIALTGWTRSVPAGFAWNGAEIIVMKTGANVCAGPLADMLYGDQGTSFDLGTSIKEIAAVGTAGNLAVTGSVTLNGGHGQLDAFLMEIVPAAVVGPPAVAALGIDPLGMGFLVYGGAANDYGRSVVEDAGATVGGYVVAGSEQSNLAGSAPADPEQLYLLKTNGLGQTTCENTPTPLTVSPGFAWACVGGTIASVLDQCTPDNTDLDLTYATQVCTPPPPPKMLPNSEPEIDLSSSAGHVVPNPIVVGQNFRLLYTSETTAPSMVSVSDVTGRSIFKAEYEGREGVREMEVQTSDWRPGVYIIQVVEHDLVLNYRVVLLDQ